MERIVETPIYEIQEEIEVLIYTMIQTFDDTVEIIEGEEVTTSTLIETKRLMPNGDYYIITGNIEEFCPIVPIIKPSTTEERLAQMDEDIQVNFEMNLTAGGFW